MKVTDYHDFCTKETPQAERRKLGIGDWWLNQAKCTQCGDVLLSRNRHDYRTCSCGKMFVDGGSWHLRRGGLMPHIVDMSEPFTDVTADTHD